MLTLYFQILQESLAIFNAEYYCARKMPRNYTLIRRKEMERQRLTKLKKNK